MADFDLGSVVQQIAGQAAGDNDLLQGLKENPAKALENMTGIDIPDEQIDAVIGKLGGIEGLVAEFAKTKAGNVEDVLKDVEGAVMEEVEGGLGDQVGNLIGGLFGKK